MPAVFFSYRRSGDQFRVDTLYDLLNDISPRYNLQFIKDVVDFKGGEDFRVQIDEYLDTCDAIVVAIDKAWIENIDRLLHDSEDWVRYEIEFALKNHKMIVPVTIDTSFPSKPLSSSNLRELASINAMPFRGNSATDDVKKIASILKDARQKAHDKKLISARNGLRGVLNLARYSYPNSQQKPNEDDMDFLLHALNPDLFGEKSSPNSHNFVFVESNQTIPTLEYVDSYKVIRLRPKSRLQIGISNDESLSTVVVYNQYNELLDKARTIIVEYSYYPQDWDYSQLVIKMGGSELISDYRLPYDSIFVCKINRENTFYHQHYFWRDTGKTIDAQILATLFEINWIGSKYLDKTSLSDIHQALRSITPRTRIIHAIELTEQ